MKRHHIIFIFTSVLLAVSFVRMVAAEDAAIDLNFAKVGGVTATSTNILGFVEDFYNASLVIGAILAFLMITWGGVFYTVSSMVDKKKEAQDIIWSAIQGLLLLLGSFLILRTINPGLVTLFEPGSVLPPDLAKEFEALQPPLPTKICEEGKTPYDEKNPNANCLRGCDTDKEIEDRCSQEKPPNPCVYCLPKPPEQCPETAFENCGIVYSDDENYEPQKTQTFDKGVDGNSLSKETANLYCTNTQEAIKGLGLPPGSIILSCVSHETVFENRNVTITYQPPTNTSVNGDYAFARYPFYKKNEGAGSAVCTIWAKYKREEDGFKRKEDYRKDFSDDMIQCL